MATARATDPSTSHEAAESVAALTITKTRAEILAILGEHPYGLTDEQIYARFTFPITPSGARTRRRELFDAGMVRDSGKRAVSSTGRSAIVWRLTQAGQQI